MGDPVSKILLSNVGVGTFESSDFVERGQFNAVLVECIPTGAAPNADLVVLDSATPATNYSPTVDANGAVVGLITYNKRRVTSIHEFVKIRLTVTAGSWTVRVTPIPATNEDKTTVTGDVNVQTLGGNPLGPLNPLDVAMVTDQGAGATIGAVADAAVDSNAVGTLSAKLRGLVKILADVWDSASHLLKVRLSSITAGRLALNAQPRVSIACALANTDYPAGAPIPAGTKYILAWAANLCIVAVDQATAAAVGAAIPPNVPTRFPITFGAGDSLVHVQSPNAGTTVYVTYLQD